MINKNAQQEKKMDRPKSGAMLEETGGGVLINIILSPICVKQMVHPYSIGTTNTHQHAKPKSQAHRHRHRHTHVRTHARTHAHTQSSTAEVYA